MGNKKINKNLTRSLVALGTICAGAVIWGSVSGQLQATPLTTQETAVVLPDIAQSSGVKLDNTLTPAITASSSTATQPIPAVIPGPAQTPAVGSTAPAFGSQPVVTTPSATTAAKPAVTVAPPLVVKTAPKLRTRGS